MSEQPLVTVGIPTYNRPYRLRKALSCVVGQTYKNLEILVADNCSTDLGARDICEEFKDSRIIFYQHDKNYGPTFNFNFLLKQAKGEYFLWAADDDQLESSFIEDCVEVLSSLPNTVAMVTKEVLYELAPEDGQASFFNEGGRFRDFQHLSQEERLIKILTYAFGNLVYGVFRRSAMFWNGVSMLETIPFKTLNEIPYLLVPAMHGEFIVLSTIGMRKTIPLNTFKQARWEYQGGRHPLVKGWIYHIDILKSWKYHWYVWLECKGTLEQLLTDKLVSIRLSRVSFFTLVKHYLTLLVGWKPSRLSSGF